ncbi:hypothetical protein PR202_gb17313 [Eleusine coracana subsp. coracana]|uniref:F-box/LRR-repeat protein 15/At3g58940/PEG3-like LRR domain-containing protein n=1 Tax=Eleusine coracana subsp. coracana TaxID=191504 RepID=A0AAV5F2F9_ELECO|nr:hypothetical protein PR202_gb17313 [Eleusine coracana subsp. coracana]
MEQEASIASAASPTRSLARSSPFSQQTRRSHSIPGLPVAPPLALGPSQYRLDHSSLPAKDEVQIGLISRILASHPGPARRLSVRMGLLSFTETVAAWLESPVLHNLQELEFQVPCFRWLMASAFRFSATLRVATMSGCHLQDDVVGTLQFPQLKQLGLGFVKASRGALRSLIAGCPVLEHLLLNGGFSSCGSTLLVLQA